MTDRFIKIFRILCGFMILIMLISAGISQSAFAADLIINGPQSADPNSLISFTVIVNNAPNHVEAFGLDILFDPNVLNVVSDPNGIITLEKGNLIQQFTVLGQKTDANKLRVYGFVSPPDSANKIYKGSIGELVKIPFTVKRIYTEDDIQVTSTFYQNAFSEDLILNGPRSASLNSMVSFTVVINNAPNDVKAFGFDILFDPNLLNVVADPNGLVPLEEGDLIDHFLVLANKISLGRVIVGGFVLPPEETNKIFMGSIGELMRVSFLVKRNYSENDIQITEIKDDTSGWTTETVTVDDISGWTTKTILGAWLLLSPDSESGLCFINILM